ncbi:MAG: hypothetical protein AAFR04_04030, partial [Pseudomonadota bacterium]
MTLSAVLAALAIVAGMTPPASAAREIVVLQAGNLEARLKLGPQGITHAAGTSVFIEATLRAKKRKRRGSTIDIVIDVDGAKVLSATGKRIKLVRDSRGRATVRATRVRTWAPRTTLIELRLGDRITRNGRRDLNTANVALRDPRTDDTDELALSWPLATCALDYHRALQGVLNTRGPNFQPIQQLLRSTDRRLPGRWMFYNPRDFRAKSRRSRFRCAKSRRRRGRWRCVKWVRRKGPTPRKREGKPTKEERALIKLVDGYVKQRGFAVEFSTRGRYYWTPIRVAADLRNYLGQGAHPALCTGAPEFVRHFKVNTGSLRRRMREVRDAATSARQIAMARVMTAQQAPERAERRWTDVRIKRAEAARKAAIAAAKKRMVEQRKAR